MLNLIGKILTLAAAPFLAYGFGLAIWQILLKANFLGQRFLAFAAGAALFSLFWLIFRRFLQVVCTFEHELTHLLVGLLFFKRPHSFVVTFTKGGYVELSGRSNFLITLAPYFLPTVSYLILPVMFLMNEKNAPLFLGLLGAATAFHLFSTRSEIHWQQSDLHKAGLLFSAVFLPVANLIFYGALLAIVAGGMEKFGSFWLNGGRESFNLLLSLFR